MEAWIESEAYDLIVTQTDLDSAGYASNPFGLPMALVERGRRHTSGPDGARGPSTSTAGAGGARRGGPR